MAFVTANVSVDGQPLKRTYVEHTGPGGIGSLGFAMTDQNGSFTFDASFIANHVDIKVYCQNSVIRVLDGGTLVPLPVYQQFAAVGNGDAVSIGQQKDHFKIMARALDVYDIVWRQFRPYNNSNRQAFPLGQRSSIRDTFADSRRIELSYPDNMPQPLAFSEPAGLGNSGYPLVHIKDRAMDGRLFGEADAKAPQHDASLLPHELGHAFHFSAMAAGTRLSIEAQYIGFIATHIANPYHQVDKPTTPFVAFIEAAGIFSERFFAFAKQVAPGQSGVGLRQAFFRDELGPQSLAGVLVDPYTNVGRRNAAGAVVPVLTNNDVEGAVYGAVYLDFASRVGLKEAVGLVVDSNATSFAEFRQYVLGRGNAAWTTAINAVRATWRM
jgi:hypothetical protein